MTADQRQKLAMAIDAASSAIGDMAMALVCAEYPDAEDTSMKLLGAKHGLENALEYLNEVSI
jgi:hypothetical protein